MRIAIPTLKDACGNSKQYVTTLLLCYYYTSFCDQLKVKYSYNSPFPQKGENEAQNEFLVTF